MMGININCDTRDFIALIKKGEKWVETRRTPSLRPYVGKRVGIVRTQKGQRARLVGYATITAEIKKGGGPWWSCACVEGTPYAANGYGYILADFRAEPFETVLHTRGIIARRVPDEGDERVSAYFDC